MSTTSTSGSSSSSSINSSSSSRNRIKINVILSTNSDIGGSSVCRVARMWLSAAKGHSPRAVALTLDPVISAFLAGRALFIALQAINESVSLPLFQVITARSREAYLSVLSSTGPAFRSPSARRFSPSHLGLTSIPSAPNSVEHSSSCGVLRTWSKTCRLV